MEEQKGAIEQLDMFLDTVKQVLDTTFWKNYDRLPEELCSDMEIVWREIEGKINDAREDLKKIDEEDLERVGLKGNSLTLKMKGFGLAVKSGVRGRIFRWINIILGSLSAVLPGVESIKEFKEVLEEGLPQQ